MRGLSSVAASGGHSSSRCAGLSPSRPLLLWSTGSRCAGSVVVAHGPSRSVACGIFPDQGSNLCPLHWQTGSQPLRHQGSPPVCLFTFTKNTPLLTRLVTNCVEAIFPPNQFSDTSWVSYSLTQFIYYCPEIAADPTGYGLSPMNLAASTLQRPATGPGCHLCFWLDWP